MIGAGVLGLCAIGVWWWAIGGKWLTVHNPSMGSAAPVGTLLWVKPTDIGAIKVGDIVTFRTPATVEQAAPGGADQPIKLPSQTYTHRVIGTYPDGTLQTKGDLDSAPDPWHTDQGHLVGRVTGRWYAAGWLVKALPLLLLGGMAWWILTGPLTSKRLRGPLRVFGIAALVAGAIFVYTPLFSATRVSYVPVGQSGKRATYVGTGVMPVKLQTPGAPSVLVHSGEEQSIMVPHRNHAGRSPVKVVPTIPWQTWPVVAAVCLILAVWSVIVAVQAPPSRSRRRRRQRRPTAAQAAPQLQTS